MTVGSKREDGGRKREGREIERAKGTVRSKYGKGELGKCRK